MDETTQNVVPVLVFNAVLLSAQAHIWHLQTTSFSEHKAFEELYLELPVLADKLAETAMGLGVSLDETQTESTELFPVEDALDVLQSFREDLEEEAGAHNSGINNIIDEMIGLLARTNYKLTNLE